jgi:hypothetical protein
VELLLDAEGRTRGGRQRLRRHGTGCGHRGLSTRSPVGGGGVGPDAAECPGRGVDWRSAAR